MAERELEADRNPYVGPYAFTRDDRRFFFGREEESRQLTSLVVARRAVLFHAPSGAGKTSLLQAKVVPELETRKKIHPLPISRVGGNAPPGVDPGQIANIYTFSTLVNLLGDEVAPADLFTTSLQEGLAPLMVQAPDERRVRPRLLILDQFEELFTTHVGRNVERSDFFRQIQESLNAYPQLSLLLSMREDYIAQLDSYVVQMPDRLRTRYRIERLMADGALLAVTGPAEEAGRHFAEGVAETLVNDLRRVQIGDTEDVDNEGMNASPAVMGPHVEPVHLQIVCRRLWASLPLERTVIEASDVQQFGDVDTALIGFYEETLTKVVTETGISERYLRRWFGEELITPARTRGLVYRGREQTVGLDNRAVDILRDAYVIRADIRGTDTWYELAHDRLVEPVMQSNSAWFVRHQRPLARDAETWVRGDRSPNLLYSGDQLQGALAELAQHPEDASDLEKEFLEQSQELERRTEMRRQRDRQLAFIGSAVVLLGLTIIAVFSAYTARVESGLAREAEARAVQEAERANGAEAVAKAAQDVALAQATRASEAERRARASELSERARTAGAQTALDDDPQFMLLLAIEAAKVHLENDDTPLTVAGVRLREAINQMGGAGLGSHLGVVHDVTFSPDNRLLATAGEDGIVRVWQVDNPQQDPIMLVGHQDPVETTAFSPDGAWLASAGEGNTVLLWPLGETAGEPIRLQRHHHNLNHLLFSPEGDWLVAASEDGALLLWSVGNFEIEPIVLSDFNSAVSAISISSDEQHLVAATDGGDVGIWRFEDLNVGPQLLDGHNGTVIDVTFSQDGDWLVSASKEGRILSWDMRAPLTDQPSITDERGTPITAFAMSRDGSYIAVADESGGVRLQTLAPLRRNDYIDLNPDVGVIEWLTFDPDGKWLAAAGKDGSILLWETADPAKPIRRFAHKDSERDLEDSVRDLTFSDDGQYLATAGSDTTARLWEMNRLFVEPEQLGAGGSPVSSLVVGGNGRWLAVGEEDGSFTLWDFSDSTKTAKALKGEDGIHQAAIDTILFDQNFARDGARIVTHDEAGTVVVWTVDEESVAAQPLELSTVRLGVMAVSPYDSSIAVVGSNNAVHRWAGPEQTPLAEYPVYAASIVIVNLAFSANGKWLAALDTGVGSGVSGSPQLGGTEQRAFVRLWNLLDDRPEILARPDVSLVSMAFIDDGEQLAASTEDGRLLIWALDDLEADPTQIFAPATPRSLDQLTFNGEAIPWLAGADANGNVLLWDMQDRDQEPIVLPGHTGDVGSIAFSSDGHWLMTTDSRGEIRVWDTGSHEGEPLLITTENDTAPVAVLNSEKGWVATGAKDGGVHLWRASPQGLVNLACQIVGRNMTSAEWDQIFSGYSNDDRKTCDSIALHPDWTAKHIKEVRDLFTDGPAPELEQEALALLTNALLKDPALDISPEVETERIANRAASLELERKGLDAAQMGNVDAAIDLFTQAITLHPGLDLDPNQAVALAVDGLVRKGQAEAQTGNVTDAIDLFTQAINLDPNLDLVPNEEAISLAVEGLVRSGRVEIQAGNVETALELFEQAKALDPTLDLNPEQLIETMTQVGSGGAPAVIAKLWKPGQTVHVRFMDGDPTVQKRVAEAAQEWTKYANLEFVFDDDPDAEIRISFENAGSWSYIGTDALTTPETDPTMNFGWLTLNSADDEIRRVVLKQFGHALGLVNAHQNPAAEIPWDREAVIEYYVSPPNNWTEAQVEVNLFNTYDPKSVHFSEFDPLSIMLYPIPNDFTIGDFEVGFNNTLSEGDKWFIGQIYPFE